MSTVKKSQASRALACARRNERDIAGCSLRQLCGVKVQLTGNECRFPPNAPDRGTLGCCSSTYK